MPEVQLLSNGRYHMLVTAAGGGYTRWHDVALTRWQEDATRDHWGSFCYLRDVDSGEFWSASYQPCAVPVDGYEAIFSDAKAEFRGRKRDFETHIEIAVSPEDDIELRRLRITKNAVSLGGVESLACHPATTTHSELSPEEQSRFGISDGLVRVSVGVEDVRDLLADFLAALDGV